MSQPFATPAPPGEGIKYDPLNGSLLLIKVLDYEDHIPTVHTKAGEKTPAVKANVFVLDGAEAGEEYLDTLIFPKVLVSQLKTQVGQRVLARLGQGNAKPGQNPPWMLNAASEADQQIGVQWINQRQQTSIQQPAPAPQQQAAVEQDVPF